MWAYPFAVILLIAILDASVKGRAMARYGWDNLPDWLRDRGVLAWRSVLVILLAGFLVGPSFLFGRYPSPNFWRSFLFQWDWSATAGDRILLAGVILGSCGVESVVYWWLLKPLGIRQEAWWMTAVDPGYYQSLATRIEPGGSEHVYVVAWWFSYPPAAPWLRVLPGFWYLRFTKIGERPTRREVYTVAGVGVVLALGVMP